jgi:RNase H-fold protein (predicted Holliday junction resolvase)
VDVDVSPVGIDSERQIRRAVFCGIDPGREKFGAAFGSADELIFSAVIPYEKFDFALDSLLTGDLSGVAEWKKEGNSFRFDGLSGIFLGGGTFHREYERRLTSAGINASVTDERMTTLEAREIYWELHPPRGLLRAVPRQWRTPPRPIDDLAAWVIMKRGISSM